LFWTIRDRFFTLKTAPPLPASLAASSWGRGGAVSQQRLHHLTCGRGAQPRTRMPHARGVAPVRRDLPETRWLLATNEEDGRAPRIAAAAMSPAAILSPYTMAPASAASALILTPSGTTPVST
jgi:hypothetical protein